MTRQEATACRLCSFAIPQKDWSVSFPPSGPLQAFYDLQCLNYSKVLNVLFFILEEGSQIDFFNLPAVENICIKISNLI